MEEASFSPTDENIPSTDPKKRERHLGLSWDDVATKLLQDKLLLTALELHTELVEAGYELPRLRDYFSNPANFEQYTTKTIADPHHHTTTSTHGGIPIPRSSSQTTLDSLDWGGLSEDGGEGTDERVAVLEFELRKARQTIQALRANLTQAAESKPETLEGPDDDLSRNSNAKTVPPSAALASIRPHEQRTLNFLVNEYLVNNSYKLTAITFADENDEQDFEHWDDVGLNTSRPPNLVHLLRDTGHSRPAAHTAATQTVHTQPTDAQTIHRQPTDSQTIHAQPTDAQTIHTQLTDAQTIHTQPTDAQTIHTQPTDSTPFTDKPSSIHLPDSVAPQTSPDTPQTGATDPQQFVIYLQKQLDEAKRKISSQERELMKLRRRTSTPSVTPLASPSKGCGGRSQAEGHPTPAPVISPHDTTTMALHQGGDGRGSPEGTSDTEEATGFVVVVPGPVRGRGGAGQDHRDTGASGADTDTLLSGYQDPSESIETLLASQRLGNNPSMSGQDTRELGADNSDIENRQPIPRGDTETTQPSPPDTRERDVVNRIQDPESTGTGEKESGASFIGGATEGKSGKASGEVETPDSQDAIEVDGGGRNARESGDRAREVSGQSRSEEGRSMKGKYSTRLMDEAKRLLKASSTRRPPDALINSVLSASVGEALTSDAGEAGLAMVEALREEEEEGGGRRRRKRLRGRKGLVRVVVQSLHNIATNVILARREVVVPLIVCGVVLHDDAAERESLVQLLFNLTKRPDPAQRSSIVVGLVVVARALLGGGGTLEGDCTGTPAKDGGSARTRTLDGDSTGTQDATGDSVGRKEDSTDATQGRNEESTDATLGRKEDSTDATLEGEVLPQLWQQLGHKYPERRLLVAVSTGAVAPYTPPGLRDSLLVSMLVQVVGPEGGERDPRVIEAATNSLALLVTFMEDRDKLPSLANTMVHCLEASQSTMAKYLLLAALGTWALEAGALPTLVDPLLAHITQVSHNSNSNNHQSLAALLEGVTRLLPYLLASLITTLPPQDPPPDPLPSPSPLLEEVGILLGGGRGVAEVGVAGLHHYVGREWFRSWSQLDYVTGRVVTTVVGALARVEAGAHAVVAAGVRLAGGLVTCLGPHLTTSALVPAILGHLGAAPDQAGIQAVRAGNTGLTSTLPLVYAAGVLGGSQGDLETFLTRHITTLAQCRAPPGSLQALVGTLLGSHPRHYEPVLAALWSCVVHPAPMVRSTTATLWTSAVATLPPVQVSSRVLPALITLATDHDHTVRAATLPPLATTITTSNTTPQVEDKVWLQMEMLCDDPAMSQSVDLQLSLPHTCCLLAHTAHTRLIHHFLLPRMCKLIVGGGGGGGVSDRLGAAMVEAYAALASCHLPDHVVAHFVLPPLNQLQKTLGSGSFEQMETITDLIKEYNLRTQSSQGLERRKSSVSLSGSLPSHPGVEEVRTKVTKMLASTNTRAASTINVALPNFLKKK